MDVLKHCMHVAFTDIDSVKLLAQTMEVLVQQPEVVSLEVSLIL